MKKIGLLTIGLAMLVSFSAFSQASGKLISSKSHVKFFSHTIAEDIEANNYTSIGTINTETGDVVFSVPMQGFEFEKSAMQKHFNSAKFLDTKSNPKSKLTAKITNFSDIDLSSDGEYQADLEGELTIKGETNVIKEKGTITVKGNTIGVESTFKITLFDYGISFVDGKPSTNVAKVVEVTVLAEYSAE